MVDRYTNIERYRSRREERDREKRGKKVKGRERGGNKVMMMIMMKYVHANNCYYVQHTTNLPLLEFPLLLC